MSWSRFPFFQHNDTLFTTFRSLSLDDCGMSSSKLWIYFNRTATVSIDRSKRQCKNHKNKDWHFHASIQNLYLHCIKVNRGSFSWFFLCEAGTAVPYKFCHTSLCIPVLLETFYSALLWQCQIRDIVVYNISGQIKIDLVVSGHMLWLNPELDLQDTGLDYTICSIKVCILSIHCKVQIIYFIIINTHTVTNSKSVTLQEIIHTVTNSYIRYNSHHQCFGLSSNFAWLAKLPHLTTSYIPSQK